MILVEKIDSYIKEPAPIWNAELAALLVQAKWADLKKAGFINEDDYNTPRCILGIESPAVDNFLVTTTLSDGIVNMENPSFISLKDFYEEHGLSPSTTVDLAINDSLFKLKKAIELIALVNPAFNCISKLVRSIQVLQQEDEEIDISYSHPKVPFSIFVSVCKDTSTLSNLRVAESIIHEAMHLKLTLLENSNKLVEYNTGNLFFSPWRDEKRPAQGVLHGLFVFRAILAFYNKLDNYADKKVMDYLNFRKEQIQEEIGLLNNFYLCPDLTKDGAILTKNLLSLN
jgi:hypothetical protein